MIVRFWNKYYYNSDTSTPLALRASPSGSFGFFVGKTDIKIYVARQPQQWIGKRGITVKLGKPFRSKEQLFVGSDTHYGESLRSFLNQLSESSELLENMYWDRPLDSFDLR